MSDTNWKLLVERLRVDAWKAGYTNGLSHGCGSPGPIKADQDMLDSEKKLLDALKQLG